MRSLPLPWVSLFKLPIRSLTLLLFVLTAIFDLPLHAQSTITPAEVAAPFGIGPIKPDPSRNVVYLVDQTYNRLLAIDTASGQQAYAASIDDGETSGEITISVDGSKLYLAESNENEILVFSLPTLTPLPTISLDFPPLSIAAAENGRLFATDSGTDGIDNNIVEISPSMAPFCKRSDRRRTIITNLCFGRTPPVPISTRA